MFALSKNKRFLCSIKKEVQDLPWALWENEDIENSNYPLKRKNLIGKVMRIENRIRSYVSNKYGSGELLDEFSGYSFFTTKKGYVMDPFNIIIELGKVGRKLICILQINFWSSQNLKTI